MKITHHKTSTQPTLSILLPTVGGRERAFNELLTFIEKQAEPYPDIEILSAFDNKEISIGAKRQLLYEAATGVYSWQIDDDDWLSDDASEKVMQAAKLKADCITFQEQCLFNGKQNGKSNFSIKYKVWAENEDGFDHVRTPFFKTPIKTDICLKVGVKDMRYAEDHQFAVDVLKHLKSEAHINRVVYIYRYVKVDSQTKYGISDAEIRKIKVQ